MLKPKKMQEKSKLNVNQFKKKFNLTESGSEGLKMRKALLNHFSFLRVYKNYGCGYCTHIQISVLVQITMLLS